MKTPSLLILSGLLLWLGLGDAPALLPTAPSSSTTARPETGIGASLRNAEAAYDRGNLVTALTEWHAAARALGASDEELAEQIGENIAFVEGELDLTLSAESPSAIEEFRAAVDALGPQLIAWLSAMALIAGWAGLRCPRTRTLGLVSAAAGALLVGHLLDRATTPGISHAIVTGEAVLLHGQPHPSFRGTRTLRPGTAVDVLESSDRWSHVRVGETDAWVPTDGLTRVD